MGHIKYDNLCLFFTHTPTDRSYPRYRTNVSYSGPWYVNWVPAPFVISSLWTPSPNASWCSDIRHLVGPCRPLSSMLQGSNDRHPLLTCVMEFISIISYNKRADATEVLALMPTTIFGSIFFCVPTNQNFLRSIIRLCNEMTEISLIRYPTQQNNMLAVLFCNRNAWSLSSCTRLHWRLSYVRR